MMTPEERARRKQEALDVKKRDAANYPGAHYSPKDLQIIFREGDKWHLFIRTKNLRQFTPSDIGGDNGWVEASVPLENINAVAELAAAIMLRLNALIEEANKEIQKIHLKPLDHPGG